MPLNSTHRIAVELNDGGGSCFTTRTTLFADVAEPVLARLVEQGCLGSLTLVDGAFWAARTLPSSFSSLPSRASFRMFADCSSTHASHCFGSVTKGPRSFSSRTSFENASKAMCSRVYEPST